MTDDKAAIPLPDESRERGGVPSASLDEGAEAKPTTADLIRQAGGGAGRGGNGHAADPTVRDPPAPIGPGPDAQGHRDTAATAGADRPDESKDEDTAPLFSGDEAGKLKARWDAIQVGFVDEPRKAVEDADSLVAQTMQRLAEMFSEERTRLEGQWDRGDDVSTEDLRVALRRYRAFFGRLLAI